MKNEPSPILVSGFYRSGTTLLRRFLDAHSSIYCGPQIKFFANFYGSEIDDPLAANRLFKTLRDQKINEHTLLDIWGKALLSTYTELAKSHGKYRWADKNPDNILYLNSWEKILSDDFKLIYIIRHPVDALASLQEIGFKHTVPQDLSTQVALYQHFNDLALNFLLKHPTRIHILTYENMVRNPEYTLNFLFKFLGEKLEPNILFAWRDPIRGRGLEDPKIDLTDHIATSNIGRGKNLLVSQAIAYIEQETLKGVNSLLIRVGVSDYPSYRAARTKNKA